jgi:hypothetical protein
VKIDDTIELKEEADGYLVVFDGKVGDLSYCNVSRTGFFFFFYINRD